MRNGGGRMPARGQPCFLVVNLVLSINAPRKTAVVCKRMEPFCGKVLKK